jgi:hypothetical protein
VPLALLSSRKRHVPVCAPQLPPLHIDAWRRGGEARFVNDCFTPASLPARKSNVYIDTIFDGVTHEFHLCFFAKEPISRGAEIITDYGPDYWSTTLRLILDAHSSAVKEAEGRLQGCEHDGGDEGCALCENSEEGEEEEGEEEEEEEEEEDSDDDESEDDDEEDACSEDSAEIRNPAFEALREELSRMGLDVILFDDCPDEVDLSSVLDLDHLLLPTPVAQRATGVAEEMRSICEEWEGEETALSDVLINTLLLPKVKATAELAETECWSSALGTLLGLLLFCSVEDGWLLDNEAHQDWPSWRGLFTSLSHSWVAVLGQTDDALGLAPEQGVVGGYRPKLLRLLTEWEDATNEALSGYDLDGREPARVDIVAACALASSAQKKKKRKR